jgi:hypothetical protein
MAMAAVMATIVKILGERGEAVTRSPRPLAALALVTIVALLSACGSKTSSDSSSSAAKVETAVKFAECMRGNGVSEFPDPDASGDFAYGIKAGSPLDPSSAAWKQAISACHNLEPAGLIPTHFTTQQTAARLKFAQCMRANGVPDFPDPTSSGPLIEVQNGQSNPAIQAGLQKCRSLLAAASGGQ